jgi:hypothetical protein
MVEAGIREAMAAGWDPESRGQPQFYLVGWDKEDDSL